MMRSLLVSLFYLLSLSSLWAQDTAAQGDMALRLETELTKKPFLPAFKPLQVAATGSAPQPFQDVQIRTIGGPKSPQKGLFFSLLFPGMGEFYAKSWIKGLFFLGVETAAWSVYASNHSKGEDLKKEFIAYAEEHWDEDEWTDWWNSQTPAIREQYAHHTLPETKTQQYYEMIGKYQKYNAGWDDVDRAIAFADTSQNGLHYMRMRGESNDKLKLASSATAIVLVNHVLSALDAVWTVTRFNKKAKPEVRVKYVMINNDPVPAINLNVTW